MKNSFFLKTASIITLQVFLCQTTAFGWTPSDKHHLAQNSQRHWADMEASLDTSIILWKKFLAFVAGRTFYKPQDLERVTEEFGNLNLSFRNLLITLGYNGAIQTKDILGLQFTHFVAPVTAATPQPDVSSTTLTAPTLYTTHAPQAMAADGIKISSGDGVAQAPSVDGQEATNAAAEMLRPWLNSVHSAAFRQFAQESQGSLDTNVGLVGTLFAFLRRPPENVATLPGEFLTMPIDQYKTGPFARGTLVGQSAAAYLEKNWLATVNKVLSGVAAQLSLPIDKLGLSKLNRLLSHLFYAYDATGELFMRNDQELDFYRWVYQDFLFLFVPWLVNQGGHTVDPSSLLEALANPFGPENDRGNDQVQMAIGQLMNERPQEFVDDPDALRKNPSLFIPWFSLLAAANLVDYTKPGLVKELADEGVVPYIMKHLGKPYLRELGADRFLREFIATYISPGEPTWLFLQPDNNAELAVVVKVSELLLSTNPNLRIAMVLKADNAVVNDASLRDGRRTAQERSGVIDIYHRLRAYGVRVYAYDEDAKRYGYETLDREKVDGEGNARLILVEGPRSQGSPWNRVPPSVLAYLEKAHAALNVGEAHTWTANGFRLPEGNVYFTLTMKSPRIIQGVFGINPILSESKFPAFVRLPNEGTFYGPNVLTPDTHGHFSYVNRNPLRTTWTGSPSRLGDGLQGNKNHSIMHLAYQILKENGMSPEAIQLIPAGEPSVHIIDELIDRGHLPKDTIIPGMIFNDRDAEAVAQAAVLELEHQDIRMVPLSRVQENDHLAPLKIRSFFDSSAIVISEPQWVPTDSGTYIFSVEHIREILSRGGPVQILTDTKASRELRVLAAAIILSAA